MKNYKENHISRGQCNMSHDGKWRLLGTVKCPVKDHRQLLLPWAMHEGRTQFFQQVILGKLNIHIENNEGVVEREGKIKGKKIEAVRKITFRRTRTSKVNGIIFSMFWILFCSKNILLKWRWIKYIFKQAETKITYH